MEFKNKMIMNIGTQFMRLILLRPETRKYFFLRLEWSMAKKVFLIFSLFIYLKKNQSRRILKSSIMWFLLLLMGLFVLSVWIQPYFRYQRNPFLYFLLFHCCSDSQNRSFKKIFFVFDLLKIEVLNRELIPTKIIL